MSRLAVIVEGPTEEDFVREVLADYLLRYGVYAFPIVIKSPKSKQDNDSPYDTTHKGGNVTVDRIVRHAWHLMDGFDWVTTLVDFYGFRDRPVDDCDELERTLLEELQQRTGQPCRNFIPYVQLHEFEALLFADVRAMCRMIPDCTEKQAKELEDVGLGFETPEHINDGPETAPSKRLEKTFEAQMYDKVSMGPIIAMEVGMETMRAKCPRFNRWIEALAHLVARQGKGGN